MEDCQAALRGLDKVVWPSMLLEISWKGITMTHWFRDLVLGLCGYEILAITTRRVPTLTMLQARYRVLGPVIIAGLAVHFYIDDLKTLQRIKNHGTIRP
jgi:hypothetical protein